MDRRERSHGAGIVWGCGPKLTRSQRDLLVILVDNEIDDCLHVINEYRDHDRRRIVGEHIGRMEGIRAKLVRLNCKV